MNRIPSARIALASAGALALTLSLATGAAPAAHAAADRTPGDTSCPLESSTLTATASVNQELTRQFGDYGDTAGAWSGGDSTFSLPLKGGELGWFFSDTFLGQVNPDGSRPQDSLFVNNSIIVQSRQGLRTVTRGTAEQPDAVAPTGVANTWYWIGDPAEGRGQTVQIPLLQFEKTGTGSFDFRWTANRLATLDGRTLQLIEVTDLPSARGINWGSWTLQEGRTTYIYGIEDVAGVRTAFVARTTGGDGLKGTWTFWDGSRWSASEQDAAPVAENVANEFSVEKFRDGYLMVTHDTSELFSTRVVAKVACSPTDTFTGDTELFRTPETGAAGSYGDADVFTYNSHSHPELTRGSRLLVTYNVNTFDNVGDVYDDASIYRPRFMDVQLSVTR